MIWGNSLRIRFNYTNKQRFIRQKVFIICKKINNIFVI